MKLPTEFVRLPVLFDAERMRQEVAALPAEAWTAHPTDYAGNSSVRLISARGEANDEVHGAMLPTASLEACPYIQQALASFGVVWSRSRLMRLAPGAKVPEHADLNYHWFRRVRLHIPVVTRPQVRFYCGDKWVHMAAGEAWIFDNWRLHRVENPTEFERIHLVADTTGSAGFWRLVSTAASQADLQPVQMPYNAAAKPRLATEKWPPGAVMPPAELELLVSDLFSELEGEPATAEVRQALNQFVDLTRGFVHDWRQLWLLHGDSEYGQRDFENLRDRMRELSAPLLPRLRARTNRIPAQRVLEGRILQHVVPGLAARSMGEGHNRTHLFTLGDEAPTTAAAAATAAPAGAAGAAMQRPVIIVAAPRSGSTLLFETLACSPQLYTLGGEGHWLIEGLESLRPGAAGVESNRLTQAHHSPALAQHVAAHLKEQLRDAAGQAWDSVSPIRFLEKTPKNALRIPLLERLFPDALYVYLWRDPRENISSIIEAWRSGKWKTYAQLPGWDGAWSLLLPPDWQSLRGASPEQVAAYQWAKTNATILDDLAQIPPQRWMNLSYAELTDHPEAAIRRICAFAGLEFDPSLQQRCAAPLPQARYTLTEPRKEKWRANQAQIDAVLPGVTPLWERLQALAATDPNRVA